MTIKLLASAPTEIEILAKIHDYFNYIGCKLKIKNDGNYAIAYPINSARAGTEIENYRVSIKKGRYRFERLSGENVNG